MGDDDDGEEDEDASRPTPSDDDDVEAKFIMALFESLLFREASTAGT